MESVSCPTCDREDFSSEVGMKIHHSKSHGVSLAGRHTTCTQCGTDIRKAKHELENAEKNFCSNSCRGAWRSENWSEDDSSLWQGGPVRVSCYQCGEEFYRKGSQVEKYDRNFCSSECFGHWRSRYQQGEDNPVWTGGESIYDAVKRLLDDEPWDNIAERERESVCQLCGCSETSDGRALAVHHIVPVMSGGCNAQQLLMTLCPGCHRKTEAYTRKFTTPVLLE